MKLSPILSQDSFKNSYFFINSIKKGDESMVTPIKSSNVEESKIQDNVSKIEYKISRVLSDFHLCVISF